MPIQDARSKSLLGEGGKVTDTEPLSFWNLRLSRGLEEENIQIIDNVIARKYLFCTLIESFSINIRRILEKRSIKCWKRTLRRFQRKSSMICKYFSERHFPFRRRNIDVLICTSFWVRATVGKLKVVSQNFPRDRDFFVVFQLLYNDLPRKLLRNYVLQTIEWSPAPSIRV